MHSAQNFGANNFVTTAFFGSGPGDRPSGPNLGLRNDISYCEGLRFASKNKKCQGLAKRKSFLNCDSRCIENDQKRRAFVFVHYFPFLGNFCPSLANGAFGPEGA